MMGSRTYNAVAATAGDGPNFVAPPPKLHGILHHQNELLQRVYIFSVFVSSTVSTFQHESNYILLAYKYRRKVYYATHTVYL